MQKSPDAFRTISEVAESLDVPQHVLRFWESKFPQVRPMKRAGGRRYYRPDDVDLLRGIRTLLYGEGYTIKGVQKVLREAGNRQVAEIGRLGPKSGGRLVLAARLGVEAEQAGLDAGAKALPKAPVFQPRAQRAMSGVLQENADDHDGELDEAVLTSQACVGGRVPSLDAVGTLTRGPLSLDEPTGTAQDPRARPQLAGAADAGESNHETGDDAAEWDAGDGQEDREDQDDEEEEFDEDDDEADEDIEDDAGDVDDDDDQDDQDDQDDEDDDDSGDEEPAQEHKGDAGAQASALNHPPHAAAAPQGGGPSRDAGSGSSPHVVSVAPAAFINAQTREALEVILKDLTILRDLLSAAGSKAEAAE